ncbi:MAG: CocE/NonD family hydrolase [Chloroflexota bacterium]
MTGDFGIVVAKDVMLTTRDDIRLAADVYRPGVGGEFAAGQFPTLLARTSYDKSAQRYVDSIPAYFTPRGFAVVLQDLRGRYRSEGTGQYFHTANVNEGRDGYDTIEWIASQAWSNGKVGMLGSSHVAMVQTAAALCNPPHLSAIWPDVEPTNTYAHQSREGGAMAMHMFGALFLHAQDSQEAQTDPAIWRTIVDAMKRMRELVYETPFKPGQTPLAVVPTLEKTLFDYYYRGAYDEFWGRECNDFARYFDRHADIPGTYSGGWFDPFAISTTTYFAAMANKNTSPQRLLMGPWTHMGLRNVLSWANDVDFGPQAIWGFERFNPEQERFFERWLKDVDNGIEHEAPIRLFVMGGGDGRRNAEGRLNHGGRWRDEREWPLARTHFRPYYLHPNGHLSPSAPQPAVASASFDFDPGHPVPTIGGNVTGFFEMAPMPHLDPFWEKYLPPWVRMRSIVPDGPMDQRERPDLVACRPPYPRLADRPDVLVFQTQPLHDEVEITGPIVVRLWVSSDCLDTDFTAKLLDIYPPGADYPEGYEMNLVDSVLRVRFRESFEREVFMQPGQVYPIVITLAPTSNLFTPGHRIRLDISSSNFPRIDVNPNTGEPMGRHTHQLVAHNSVYFDRARPSHLVLPVIPA